MPARVNRVRAELPQQEGTFASTHRRRQLGLLLVAATATLAGLFTAGVVIESSARTPLARVGQAAPDFILPSSEGGMISLAAVRGQPVLLGFVPSVLCSWCKQQLQSIEEALPELRARNVAVFVVSTDEGAVQRKTAQSLGLSYPLGSEAPTRAKHPVGSAYGVYHYPQGHPAGPVEANGLVIIDATGTIRAVRIGPGRQIDSSQIHMLLSTALGPVGDGR